MLHILILQFLFLIGTVSAHAAPSHEFIKSSVTKEKIEIFWTKPESNGPWPVLLLVHPHQEWPNKIGAEMFVKNGSLDYWSSKGFLTVAVSQPGYGQSEGAADFCGPRSQAAVIQAIHHFKEMPNIRKNAFFLYGGSRGAVIAGLLASKGIDLAGIMLKSGLYDFVDTYHNLPWYSGLKLTMIWEIGWNNETELKARSALHSADKIKTPLLIIHGENDDKASIVQAENFAKKVRAAGGKVEFVRLHSEHVIPMQKIKSDMEYFMRQLL